MFYMAINTITHWNSLWQHNYCRLKKDLYMKAQKAYTCRLYYVWFDPDVEAVLADQGHCDKTLIRELIQACISGGKNTYSVILKLLSPFEGKQL